MTLPRQHTIVGIHIYYADIGDEIGTAIARIIQNSPNIKECVITGGRISLTTYKALTVAMQTNTSLSLLLVNFNGNYEQGLDAEFAYALSVNPNRPLDSCWSFIDGKDDAYRRIREKCSGQVTVKQEPREFSMLFDAYSTYWQPSGPRRRRS
jgi:hypothetical protein